MSIKKQMSVKTQLKSLENALVIVAGRLDELSNSFCYEAMKTQALVKLLAEKGILTEEEHENKLNECIKEALEKAQNNIDNKENNTEEETKEEIETKNESDEIAEKTE